MAKEKKVLDLEKTIKKHQDLYYNAQPEISDAEFDALWDELKALDPQNKLFLRFRWNLQMGLQSRSILFLWEVRKRLPIRLHLKLGP